MKAFAFFILLSIVLSCSKEPDYRDKYVGLYKTELSYINRDTNIIQKDTGIISIEIDNDEDSGLILNFGTKMRFEEPPSGAFFDYFYIGVIRKNILSVGRLKLKINSAGRLYTSSYNGETQNHESEFYIYSNLQLCIAFGFSNYMHTRNNLRVRFNGIKL